MPVYVIFLIKRGLNYKGVALVDGFYMVSSALLDYPTGGLADKYGRGFITALGSLFLGLGLLSYGFSTTLCQFLFSEFLAAIGSALYSGAFIAWLVDSLKKEGRSQDLPIILSNTRILSQFISSLGAFIGGILAEYSLELPFILGAFISFSAFALTLFYAYDINKTYRVREIKYIDFLRKGLTILFKHKQLLLLTMGSFLISFSIPSFTLTWAPYMEYLGANKWLIGLASAIFMIVMGIGSYAGGRMAKWMGYRKTIMSSIMLISISFSLLILARDPYMFILISIFLEIGFGIMGPVLSAWINKYIPSEERATVVSLRRTLILPFTMLGMMTMGILSDLGSPRLTYIFVSIAIVLALPIYLKIPNDEEVI